MKRWVSSSAETSSAMMNVNAIAFRESFMSDASYSLDASQRRTYLDDGFVILRDVFSSKEMAELATEAERLMQREDLISSLNLRCRFMPHCETGDLLFEVFDPVNDIAPVCERFSREPRIVHAVESLYGEPACLFKDKLIFKPPGAMGYRLHQDIPLGWAGFPKSFLTVLIPIDSSSEGNGCTEVFAGYHRGFLSDAPENYMLADELVDNSRRTFLALEPGDVAIFHGFTPHRSQPNRSHAMRRSLFISFNASSDGGDQRDTHYAEFRQKMLQRRPSDEQAQTFFR